MRARREKIFNDPFYKKDRSAKNLNKVNAAKRRKRDGTGKFEEEEEAAAMLEAKTVILANVRPRPSAPLPNLENERSMSRSRQPSI